MPVKLSRLFLIAVLALPFSLTSAQQIDPPSLELDAGPADTTIDRLIPELQRALEADSVADDLQGIVVLCANACELKAAESKPTRVRKPMQDVKNVRAQTPRANARARERASSNSAVNRDTAMASIQNIRALTCDSPLSCVDLISRNDRCKAGTVQCGSSGCSCEAK